MPGLVQSPQFLRVVAEHIVRSCQDIVRGPSNGYLMLDDDRSIRGKSYKKIVGLSACSVSVVIFRSMLGLAQSP